MKSRFLLFITTFLFLSCSGGDSTDPPVDIVKDEFEITYLGYWDKINGDFRSRRVVFTEFDISYGIEQIEGVGEVPVMHLEADSQDDITYKIRFTVKKDMTGNSALFSDHFSIRAGWPTYHKTNEFEFKVLTNTDKEFSAQFSGDVEHWNQNTGINQISHINSGTIKLTL